MQAITGPKTAIALAIAALGAPAFGQVDFTVVAASGEQAPGLEPGITFDFFDMVRANGGGDVVFQADLAGDGVDELTDGSLWSDRSGDLSLLYREGDEAPFDNLVLYRSLTSPAFNEDSSVAFGAALHIEGGPEETTVGLFSEDASHFLTPFAVDGTVLDEIELSGLTPAPFIEGGRSAFVAADGAGLWLNDPVSGPMLIASAGGALEGMPDGTEIKHISRPALSDNSDLAFHASFSTPDNDGPNLDHGLWTGDDADPSVLAVTGQQAPGYVDGIVFSDFARLPVIHDEGFSVGFFAKVDGPGIHPGNDGAIWFGEPGEIATIAREGSYAPGTEPVADFAALPTSFAIAGNNMVAFTAQISGAGTTPEDNSGIWAGEFDQLELLVREGDAAPGTGGATFGSFSTPAMTETGYVAFTARLRQDEPEFGDNHGLFLAAPDGSITLLAREGEAFDLGGEEKIISDISFDSRADGRSSLTHDGTAYVKLYFEDRSQALVIAGEGCAADFNGDGELNVLDFVAFQLAWENQEPSADCDADGEFDIVDFVCFQELFQAGCP